VKDLATVVVAGLALIVSLWTAWRQQKLAIAHAGAQSAMAWRDQVIALHDRGLEPEEIRWIMYCEDGGHDYETGNGIIDEVLCNVPRQRRNDLEPIEKDRGRWLPRPEGKMRAGDGEDALPLQWGLTPRAAEVNVMTKKKWLTTVLTALVGVVAERVRRRSADARR
jgi:hypothetical protein